jgi:hypothetical protein
MTEVNIPQVNILNENYPVPAVDGLSNDEVQITQEICRLCGLPEQFTLLAALEYIFAGIVEIKPEQEKRINFVLATLYRFQPKDVVETMLIVQFCLSHEMAIKMFKRSLEVKYEDEMERFSNLATKLTRNCNQTAETVSKIQRKGIQKMVVEHVTVENGGQAIVGNVPSREVKRR